MAAEKNNRVELWGPDTWMRVIAATLHTPPPAIHTTSYDLCGVKTLTRDFVIVDPASDDSMRTTLHGGGASGAIYRYLHIRGSHLTDAQRATYMKEGAVRAVYGPAGSTYDVIHTVGPMGDAYPDEREFLCWLTRVYESVLAAYSKMDTHKRLLLLPISSSIYAGPHAERMSMITACAVAKALQSSTHSVDVSQVVMNLFPESIAAEYEADLNLAFACLCGDSEGPE